MSKFFQVPGADGSSDLSSSDEESLYGSSASESLSNSASDSEMSEDLSDSGSDSDEGSDAHSEGEEDGQPRNQYLRNQFLKGSGGGDSDSESESDDERVAVKSAKDKLLDEVAADASKLDSARTDEDWLNALSMFDKLMKATDRANKQYATVPAPVMQVITQLETVLAEKDTKKLSPSMSKAKNTLRQRLKKIVREYATRLESYRKDPENYEPGTPSIAQQLASKTGSRADSPVAGGAQPSRQSETTTAADDEVTPETVFKTLIGVVEGRGRKNTDKAEQVTLLERQLAVADDVYRKVSVLLVLIPLRFDLSAMQTGGHYSSLHGGADFGQWELIERDIRQLFEIIESQDEYVVIESAPEPENIEDGPAVGPSGLRLIPGSLPTLVELLDDEHARILATYDPHTTEYIERLRDETRLGGLFLRAQCHQENALTRIGTALADSESFCRLLARRIDHIYYKPVAAIAATEATAWAQVPSKLNSKLSARITDPQKVDAIALLASLGAVLYRQANTGLRARAMLSQIYQHALQDDYYKARDLMLMSHLQSSIHVAEPATQVLFNRALVQVGLCAFRAGLVSDALQSLQEICASSRLKELLGQGQSRQTQQVQQSQPDSSVVAAAGGVQPPELLPYHMHINLELVECVYLTASMLTEVPYLANVAGLRSAQLDLKKRSINRPFRRLLDMHDRQVFSGPSETTRDYVIQSAKRLQTGDWRGALESLSSIKVWNLLSPAPDSKAKILQMLEHKLKIEGLRTYLLTYGPQAYHSVSIEFLQNEFELSAADAHQLLVKMISSDEIPALLDSSSGYLVFKPEADASRLQMLALALADKASQLAERNERLAADGHVPEQLSKRPIRARN